MAWIAEWGSNGQTVSHARFEQMAPVQKGEMSPGIQKGTSFETMPSVRMVVPMLQNVRLKTFEHMFDMWHMFDIVWSYYSNRFSNHQNMFLTFFYMLMYRMWLLLGNPTLALPTGRVLWSTARRSIPQNESCLGCEQRNKDRGWFHSLLHP